MSEPSADDSNEQSIKRPTSNVTRNARFGLILFCVYLSLYAGFVLINTFRPGWMGQAAVRGVNLAIVYGMGLIVAALLLAIVYMAMCRDDASGEGRK